MSPVYITCKVLPGIFDDECYVMVNGSAAYYVNNRLVRVQGAIPIPSALSPDMPVEGDVKGYLVEQSAGKMLVQLPGEAVVGGIRTWVGSDAVRAT